MPIKNRNSVREIEFPLLTQKSGIGPRNLAMDTEICQVPQTSSRWNRIPPGAPEVLRVQQNSSRGQRKLCSSDEWILEYFSFISANKEYFEVLLAEVDRATFFTSSQYGFSSIPRYNRFSANAIRDFDNKTLNSKKSFTDTFYGLLTVSNCHTIIQEMLKKWSTMSMRFRKYQHRRRILLNNARH